MTDSKDEFTLTAAEAASLRLGFTYCPRCRTELADQEVYGKVRRVCSACRFVQFIDPKVGTAVLVEQEGQVVLVKRSMEPGRGDWCLPGGFMEMGETPHETTRRECWEETGLEVEIIGLIDVFYYENYRGSGVVIMYKGVVTGGELQAGDDAEEVRLFAPEALPKNIAFDSNVQVLTAWLKGEL